MSAWREERNARSLVRLRRSLPDAFPAGVLAHALARPFTPPTARRAVESYWRAHPLRADRLARALARRSGAPEGWTWRLGAEEGLAGTFRLPPAPYREPAFARGAGHCCVCGQPVYRYGWHRPLAPGEVANRNARWHAACVIAWKFWCDPADQAAPLKRRQARRCAETGKRLLKGAEVDHRTPLFRVWREHRGMPWPELIAFWGAPNLGVVNRTAHRAKCAEEAGSRSGRRGEERVADPA
jgi:hypothetical protein